MTGIFSFLKINKQPPLQLQAIGKGAFGPKAQCLLDDRERIIKAGIGFPKLIPITSEIFKQVADESGASKAPNEHEAFKCLYSCNLSPQLLLQISDGALSFGTQANSGRAVMVRTDDYAGGLGITYSGPAAISSEQSEEFAAISPGQPDELFVSRIVRQLKRAWASCLSENFQIFAQMKGLKDIGATMLMPVYGMPALRKQDGANDLLYTPISINFLGKFGTPAELSVFSVGTGIGGANRRNASIRFSSLKIDKDAIVHALFNATFSLKRNNEFDPLVLDMSRSKMVPSCSATNMDILNMYTKSFSKNLDKNTAEINNQISQFSSGVQRYAEFLLPNLDFTELVCVQTFPVRLEPANSPKLSRKSIILESDAVIGSSSVSTRKVRFAGRAPTADDICFNKENRGYLLVIDAGESSWNFKWELKHLHNAGAVVICVDNDISAFNFEFSTHLSGYFRELGILVLGANAASAAEFRKKLRADSECLVFADEFSSDGKPNGFVALI